MRYQNIMIGIVGFLLAAAMAVGTVYSEQFPQASHAESVGFDALAHDLLGDLFDADQSTGPAK